MTTSQGLPHGPYITAEVSGTSATVTFGGEATRLENLDANALAGDVLRVAAGAAAAHGRPLHATITDEHGRHELIVNPDGSRQPYQQPAPAQEHAEPLVDAVPQWEPAEPAPPALTVHPGHLEANPTPPASPQVTYYQQDPPQAAPAPTQAPAEQPALTRRELRQSFLTQDVREEPATHGWRTALRFVGLRLAPSAAERAERADVQAVSQHWPGPRTIAVVNAKGGAGKTPATVLLSAVFARYGGAGVLAWDNNQTRGTLGWRTEQGPHDASLLDLLPQAERLLGTGAQSADLAHFVHHQTQDRYDVLRSKPMELADAQRVDAGDVDAIHQVASKYYRLIVIDSGNDESDPMWRRMIDHTDQLVVATTTRDDHAEAGALLLEALAERDERSARLAAGAVTVVSQADPRATRRDVDHIANGFTTLAREVVTIPHDSAIVDGLLRYGALRPATQRAWLAAAAAVARGL
jgi:MinD-like ATPase involved in chromosome partitioning or flagellar assembly